MTLTLDVTISALLTTLHIAPKYVMLCLPPKVWHSISHTSLQCSILVKISNTVPRLCFTKVFSSKDQKYQTLLNAVLLRFFVIKMLVSRSKVFRIDGTHSESERHSRVFPRR